MRNIPILILIVTCFLSCKDKDSILGLEMQGQFEIKFDTIRSITVSTKKSADSVSLTGAKIGLLGEYTDPVFGHTQAVLAFQLGIKSSVFNLGDDPVGESVVLIFNKRSNYYGQDSIFSHDVKVWRVKEKKDLKYLHDSVVSISDLEKYKGTLLSDKKIIHNKDSVNFRIKLDADSNLAQELLDSAKKEKFSTDAAFQKIFPGIIVETVCRCEKGNIIYVEYSANLLTLRVHYQSSLGKKRELDFVLKDDFQRFSIFNHEYDGTDVGNALDKLDDPNKLGYIQGMNGVGLQVEIDISSLISEDSEDEYSVNSAVLKLKLAEGSTEGYPANSTIHIRMPDGDKEVFTPDYSATVTTVYFINYDSKSGTDGGYNIHLTRLLFNKLKTTQDKKVIIMVYANQQLTSANRAIVAGGDYEEKKELRPVLEVVRSK